MNCPKCKSTRMHPANLDTGLSSLKCDSCSGHWLNFTNYLRWQQNSEIDSEEMEELHGEFDDTNNALICPSCTKILSKYRVTANAPFIIDECGKCSGIWFDKNEWQSIASQGLSNKIHLFFTSHWQKNVQKELSNKRKIEIFKTKFGEENFSKLEEIKEWLKESQHRDAMLAYLMDEE